MKRHISALALLLLGAAAAPAATLNDFYFGVDMMRNYVEVYWWFLPDGRVLNGLPRGGPDPANFDAACNASPQFCGNYTLNGDKLSIHYRSGADQQWTYKPLKGGIHLNYIILTPVARFPAGARLNGTWGRAMTNTVATSSTTGVAINSPNFYTFRADGTYTRRTSVEVDNMGSASRVDQVKNFESSGAYTLQGYTLTLTGNGGGQHTIFPVAG